jgi:hypothetical protein
MMTDLEFRCTLREKKGGLKVKYYFGEPAPDPVYIEHWKYAIPGELTFNGSTLIFRAKNFTPKQPRRNKLLDFYFNNPDSRGTLILKLDLRELKKIKKFLSSYPSHNGLRLQFKVHGSFLNDNIKNLNFVIRSNSKIGIKDLYNKVIEAKNSENFDSKGGSLRFVEK